MNKALLIAGALALSASAFAGGGAKHGASADAYIDKNAQIAAKDCQMLSVESARKECMRQAQGGSGMQGNVGATSGSGMGQGSGGKSMHSGSPGTTDSGPRSPTQQAR